MLPVTKRKIFKLCSKEFKLVQKEVFTLTLALGGEYLEPWSSSSDRGVFGWEHGGMRGGVTA